MNSSPADRPAVALKPCLNLLPFPLGRVRTSDWRDMRFEWLCRFGWQS